MMLSERSQRTDHIVCDSNDRKCPEEAHGWRQNVDGGSWGSGRQGVDCKGLTGQMTTSESELW